MVKVEDSQEIKWSNASDTAECLCCIEFLVGLGANGDIETKE